MVHFPPEIVAERLLQNIRAVRNSHHDMMFEALAADVAQKLL